MSDARWLVGLLFCAAVVSNQSLLADELDNPPVPDRRISTNAKLRADALRVALVDSGINYLLPEINGRLARSEGGKLIGYDFWDMDERPFDSHPDGRGGIQRHGTRTASLLLREAPFVELVAYRYPRPDMQRMVDLIDHADAHDVRVIGLPLGGNLREQWIAFEAAAKAHPHILFVASAGNNGRDIDNQPVFPAALSLDNMLVVTSADDFGRVANGVNWGRSSVDYMVPAEALRALRFDGSEALVSGSSYAVPRVVALAARYLRNDPELNAAQLMKLIRSRFANGAAPEQLAQGYLYDPRFDDNVSISVTDAYPFETSALLSSPSTSVSHGDNEAVSPDRLDAADESEHSVPVLMLPLQVLVLDKRWQVAEVLQLLKEAEMILGQCRLAFASVEVEFVQGPDYIRDLEAGSARTLMEAVRLSGSNRKLTVVFARDTLMSAAFDAEAFGRGNTRQRPWLTDSVWLTLALQDRDIALAHELFHVLVNSGQHSNIDGSLMLARTTGSNTRLTSDECTMARERALELGLVFQ